MRLMLGFASGAKIAYLL